MAISKSLICDSCGCSERLVSENQYFEKNWIYINGTIGRLKQSQAALFEPLLGRGLVLLCSNHCLIKFLEDGLTITDGTLENRINDIIGEKN